MDIEVKRFEDEYQKEKYTIRALVTENVTGAQIAGKYYIPSVTFGAYIDERTEQLFEGKGTLRWITPMTENENLFFYEFGEMKIYRLSVQRKIEEPYEDPKEFIFYNNEFKIIEILEENISDSRLDFIRNKLNNPIKMKSNIGEFFFSHKYDWFEGLLDWQGFEANVYLELDEEGTTAKKALSYLRKVCKKKIEWNEYLVDYIFGNFEEVTGQTYNSSKEDIRKEIYLTEIYVHFDGEMEFTFRANEILSDHYLVIRTNPKGKIEEMDLQG